MSDIARIAQRMTRIKQRWGSPFNVAKVDVITDGDKWIRCPRAVALMPQDTGEVLVYFAGEGRTFKRFVELAKEQLRGYEILDGDGEEIALVVLPKDPPPQPEEEGA